MIKVNRINGSMSYFPDCCSTGILKGLSATEAPAGSKPNVMLTEEAINNAPSVHELIRAAQVAGGRPIMPVEWGAWYALSLIHQKVTTGKDDSGDHAYGNYKAAQVTWFDRINADKRNGKRFNSYNMTFACDSLTEWLGAQDKRKFGQVLVSKAVDGAHGARVRGCVYTPNISFLGTFLDECLKEMKKELVKQRKEEGISWQIK